MKSIKIFISILLYYIGRIFRCSKNRTLSIYFHNPTPESFEQIVLWLIRHNFKFVDLPTLLKHVDGTKKLKGKHVYISFDDAWKGNLDLIPIIEKYNVPITIFSPIEPLVSGNYWWEYVKEYGGMSLVGECKKYPYKQFITFVNGIKNKVTLSRSAMTIEELKKISNHPLVDIQSHSYTHPILTNISNEELTFELMESKKELERILGMNIYVFSFPNGSYSLRELKNVERYYKYSFTTELNDPKFNSNVYEIPRIALTDDYWSNLAKIMKMWKFRH